MTTILYTLRNIMFILFQASLLIGILLVVVYVIFNAFYNSRNFYKTPRWMKNFISFMISFSSTWGPNLLVFYILGRLLLSILSFLGLA